MSRTPLTEQDLLDRKLFISSHEGNLGEAAAALGEGANVNATEINHNRTPIFWAAERGNTELVEFLIARGADLNANDLYEKNALYYAAQNGHTNIVKVLLDAGANIEGTNRDRYGDHALTVAARSGRTETVVALINAGADLTGGKSSEKPLEESKKWGRAEITEILRTAEREQTREKKIEHGAGLTDGEKRNQVLCFLHGVVTGNTRECQDAIEGRMHADLRDQIEDKKSSGATVEELYAFTETIKPINGPEAIRAHRFTGGRTALHVLAENPALGEAAQGLADVLVNKSMKEEHDKLKADPTRTGYVDPSSFMDVNAVDAKGRTALHTAVIAGNKSLIEQLALNGADINATLPHDGGKVTALEYALITKNDDMASFLVKLEDHGQKLVGKCIPNPLQFAAETGMSLTEAAIRQRAEDFPKTVRDLPQGALEATYARAGQQAGGAAAGAAHPAAALQAALAREGHAPAGGGGASSALARAGVDGGSLPRPPSTRGGGAGHGGGGAGHNGR